MIQVRHLTKRLGRVAAVNDLSFHAPAGAITGLLGPNGAGKTTALRMISGMLRPDAGTIRLDGACPYADPATVQGRLGALLDHTGLYPRLTAREHLVYFGRLRGMTSAILEDRVERVLDDLELGGIADRRTAGFSQGERMKIALGRAMIHQPDHLLLDEPTNGLDVPTVRALRLWLGRRRDAGACIILSSHIVGDIEALCDHLVILANGSLAAEGSQQEVRARAACGTLEDAFLKLAKPSEVLSC